jgi:hypothetical protein
MSPFVPFRIRVNAPGAEALQLLFSLLVDVV